MMAEECYRALENFWMNGSLDVDGKDNHTKPYRKKRFSTAPGSTHGTIKYIDINKLFLIIIIIFNLITVTIANVNIESLKETNLNIKNLFNSIALSNNKSQSSNVLIFVNLNEKKTAQQENSGLIEKRTTTSEPVIKDFHLLEKLERNKIFKEYERKEEFRNETILSTFQKRRRRRKKRYVRFPPGEGGRFAKKFHSRPFHSGPQISGGSYSSGFFPWSPIVRPNSFYSHVPTMRPRSPRLVFRDPVEPGTLNAPTGFFGSGLQDIAFDDDRGCGVSIGKLGAQRRIVGGDEAGFGSFPWQAYIRIGSSRCGGSLVNRFHVVTAGHCVARASARQVQVTLGDYVINSAVEPLPAYTFGVREIRVHPYFKFTPQADRFDVAVLRLDRPVQYMPHIAPICLPEKNEDFLGQYGWAAGWGALQAGSRLRPKTLQAVDVPVIDNRQCERWHKSNGINVVIYDEMMCAGYRNGGKDSCQGDSGGPLMMEKANRWYLIGIVSAGYSCAQRGQPGIYHRVAHTVDWISYIINS